jgi:hypothetical protein
MSLTVRTRIAPILLRLAWDGNPLIWSDKYGWTFRVPLDKVSVYENQALTQCDMTEEKNLSLRDDKNNAVRKLDVQTLWRRDISNFLKKERSPLSTHTPKKRCR